MPKSVAGAYAIVGTVVAIAIIVVAGSTVGVFGSRSLATAAGEVAPRAAFTQSSGQLDPAAAAPGDMPTDATQSDTRGEHEDDEEREHEERDHAERGRSGPIGFLRFLRDTDD